MKYHIIEKRVIDEFKDDDDTGKTFLQGLLIDEALKYVAKYPLDESEQEWASTIKQKFVDAVAEGEDMTRFMSRFAKELNDINSQYFFKAFHDFDHGIRWTISAWYHDFYLGTTDCKRVANLIRNTLQENKGEIPEEIVDYLYEFEGVCNDGHAHDGLEVYD